jgi:hypothetical protein
MHASDSRLVGLFPLSTLGTECVAIVGVLYWAFSVRDDVPYVIGLETHTFSGFDSLIQLVLAKQSLHEE